MTPPKPERALWWNTKTAESYELKGLATLLVGRAIAYLGPQSPDNDRDHIKW